MCYKIKYNKCCNKINGIRVLFYFILDFCTFTRKNAKIIFSAEFILFYCTFADSISLISFVCYATDGNMPLLTADR